MTTNSTWAALNNKHQESGTLTGPLIFTLPALNLVAMLRLDWLDRFAETTIKHGHPLHSAVARAELWLGSIAACALVLATSSFADREVGDLGGVGKVQFENSCSKEVRGELMRGHALLHSMFYDEAIAVLNGVATKDTNCAMAHWGVAMAYCHPLWAPPTPEELKNGAAALAKAKEVEKASQREKDFIAALEVFYKDAHIVPHSERAKAFEKAMGECSQARF